MRFGVLTWGAATAALVASGAVNSTDLRPAAKAPPKLWSWTGGYIGGHVGGGYGRTSFSDPYGPSIYGDVVDTPAFLAGGQLGYNWQRDRWVFGLELEASRAVSDGTNTCLAFSSVVVIATCNAGPSVLATGTGRVGYAFGPQGHTLAYVKGGAAWQSNRGAIANHNEFRDGTFAGFPRHKLGAFVGWTYHAQKSDSTGCVQASSSSLTWPCNGSFLRQRLLVDSQDTNWNAPRIGLGAALVLERWRVSAEIAYLPWTEFSGRDNHLLPSETTFYDQRGDGGEAFRWKGRYRTSSPNMSASELVADIGQCGPKRTAM
ncbi:outer membrane protein [Bradyrhizobium sp. WSM3983]|uniref:outer membrane protein n=1 Tax=Bradyrhizobium sp. WSM3983 TaxID=1038867 RepID=UPI0004856F4E|nr:outer membrane beta-barrel protein [Bradyrhizobium sp. WSM3983]